MALCVMTPGTIRMPLWSADNWDSPPMVGKNMSLSMLIFNITNTTQSL